MFASVACNQERSAVFWSFAYQRLFIESEQTTSSFFRVSGEPNPVKRKGVLANRDPVCVLCVMDFLQRNGGTRKTVFQLASGKYFAHPFSSLVEVFFSCLQPDYGKPSLSNFFPTCKQPCSYRHAKLPRHGQQTA